MNRIITALKGLYIKTCQTKSLSYSEYEYNENGRNYGGQKLKLWQLLCKFRIPFQNLPQENFLKVMKIEFFESNQVRFSVPIFRTRKEIRLCETSTVSNVCEPSCIHILSHRLISQAVSEYQKFRDLCIREEVCLSFNRWLSSSLMRIHHIGRWRAWNETLIRLFCKNALQVHWTVNDESHL